MEFDIKKRFITLIETMDIPELRREINEVNIRWFLRNALIRNMTHPNIKEAISIAKKLIK